MSSVSGTSSSLASYRSNGLSGLVSGLDTDSMVEKMLQGTQTKIDKQNRQKQLLEWKQTMYRSVIADINTFRNKYFDLAFDSALQSNLSSGGFFNSMVSSVSSGSSVKVVGTSSSAFAGTTSILVSQLASAAKLVSGVKMSGSQTITGAAMDVEAIKSKLLSGAGLAFDLALDGVSKTIAFSSGDFSGEISAETVKSALDAKVKTAFGTYVGVDMMDGRLSFSINLRDEEGNVESGHELRITGANAACFGVTPGSSSLLSTTTALKNISGVTGDAYRFSINGVDFAFSSSDTVASMLKAINASAAGVKMSYSAVTDQFKMEATSTGAQYGIEISQGTGNLLSVMFGSDVISEGPSATGPALNASSVGGSALGEDYTTNGASMAFQVNGASYTFTLEESETGYTKSQVESALNDWLSSTFGTTDGAANIRYADGRLETAAGYSVSFKQSSVDPSDQAAVAQAAKTDLAVAMGFSLTGASNAVAADMRISDVAGLSGVTFLNANGEAASTLSEIASVTIGADTCRITYENGRLSIFGEGALQLSGSALAGYFGDSITLGSGAIAAGAVTAGTDARVTVNGVETSRSSNTFTADGLTVTATKVSTEETVIDTDRDIGKIVDAVKSFVGDYNAMIKKFYGYLTEDDEYRSYAPLTDAQKKEMSDSEIEKWNQKAQTGLLRNDTYVSSFLQSMRTAFYTKVESVGIAAYSIGMETTKDDYAGQLTLDETALRNAVAADPEAVARLFTDSTNGLSAMLTNACDKTAKLSVASPGSLVKVAGASGWSANAKTNDMYYLLEKLNDKLDKLKDRYDDERERYWAKFNAMESVIAQYNSQSAMITSTFSSGY